MGWFALGSAAVGLVGSYMSSNATKKANKSANAMAQKELDFQKQRYQDWKDVYGDLQEDIGAYYENLNGETLVGKELEYVQEASQASETKIHEALAQRGIDGAGLEGMLQAGNIINTEVKKAELKSSSEQRAMDLKTNFLNVGLGQGQQISNSMSNANNNLASGIRKAGDDQATAIGRNTALISNGLSAYGQSKRNSNNSGGN